MSIAIRAVAKTFGDYPALKGVDLDIAAGELVALLGPSGSGKTTLLRILAGLEWPETGDVLFGESSVLDRSARERRIGFVFQHYALFRHMTVFENVAFGLRVLPRRARPPKAEIADRVRRLLDKVQLAALADRYPAQLSGGQRQRVALARALAIEPGVLLLDEPFGALDARVRKDLRRWLRRLHDELGTTTLFVTHDQEEALELADRVVVMSEGRIEQVGTPVEIYDRPANAFVQSFLGSVNRIPCAFRNGVWTAPGFLPGSIDPPVRERSQEAVLFVRPHQIEVAADPHGGAVVRLAMPLGALLRLEVEVDPALPPVEIELPRDGRRDLAFRPGQHVTLSLN